MKNRDITTIEELNRLYKNSALTFEGIAKTPENMNFIENWLNKYNARTDKELVLLWIKGSVMNEKYNLTGDNAYPDDLTILVIEPDSIITYGLILKRFEIGGRWFDDVVDNNARREEE